MYVMGYGVAGLDCTESHAMGGRVHQGGLLRIAPNVSLATDRAHIEISVLNSRFQLVGHSS
jgi:hypothetical protein